MHICEIILAAKLGRHRKDAQVDACAPFAAALYDVLKANQIPCSLYVAAYHTVFSTRPEWYHAVVHSNGVYYDSRGAFSLEIFNKREKIHAKSQSFLTFKRDKRVGFFEDEDLELHAFFVKQLQKVIKKPTDARNVNYPALKDGACSPLKRKASQIDQLLS